MLWLSLALEGRFVAMRDPRLDELIQMETWDWWKARVFYLREKKDYADAEALFMEFKIPLSDANN